MSFRATFAALFLLATTTYGQTMVTHYNYVFDYTFPQPSVQSVAGEVGRPIRIDVQVVGGDSSPLDIDEATLSARIIQPEDDRLNQVASVFAVNLTNGQYYISVTPTLSGTASIRVDAFAENGSLIAMVGQFDLTITAPVIVVSQASTINAAVMIGSLWELDGTNLVPRDITDRAVIDPWWHYVSNNAISITRP